MENHAKDGFMTHSTLKDLLTRRLGEEGVPIRSPIAVAELYRRLVPYSICRDALGLATKAEYDMAVLRLLADDGSLDVTEEALREAVSRELSSPEPGLAILQRFAASEVRLVGSEDDPSQLPDRPTAETAGPPPFTYETERLAQDRIPGLDDLEFVPEPLVTDDSRDPAGTVAATACKACSNPLPGRDGLRYCPSCGADQRQWPCRSCGSVVERGWKFCAMCGTAQPA
jgi:RNA polymerase subunit RPABC4/transcription elongation factor Spt4